MRSNKLTSIGLLFVFAAMLGAQPKQSVTDLHAGRAERVIAFSIDISAPVDKVWERWTTGDGITKFLAPAAKIEIKPLGEFSVYFRPEAPAGQRGAEGNMVMAVQDKQMLSFTWDAPPKWPEIRKQRTLVVLRFGKLGENGTRLTLEQTGWGRGPEWDEVYAYFVSAWGIQFCRSLNTASKPVRLTGRIFQRIFPRD